MNITVEVKTSNINEIEKIVKKIGEMERVNPGISVHIEVDCREKVEAPDQYTADQSVSDQERTRKIVRSRHLQKRHATIVIRMGRPDEVEIAKKEMEMAVRRLNRQIGEEVSFEIFVTSEKLMVESF